MANNTIVDRRQERDRSSPNRDRLIKRVKGQIKKAMPDLIQEQSIENVGKDGKGIRVPIKGLDEPTLHHDPELGDRDHIYSGNDKWKVGDQIKKPLGDGGGGGQEGSEDPATSEDDFFIELSREEFIKEFFGDLELPNLEEKQQKESVDSFEMKHAGVIQHGIPPRLNVIRSVKNSIGRRKAIQVQFERQIEDVERNIETEEDEEVVKKLLIELESLKRRASRVPYLDEVDLRYDHYIKEPIPIDSAVVFALMDVSISMGKEEKDLAKRFFFFLYLFLESQYKEVDIVWIRHHTAAERVNEEDFFNKRETGGTIVSTALELAHKIKMYGDKDSPGGYPTNLYNIYFAQCTDGDNAYNDMDRCKELMPLIMSYSNYFAYIQIRSPGEYNLWKEYSPFAEKYSNFKMRHVSKREEIWKVFHGLFKKRDGKGVK